MKVYMDTEVGRWFRRDLLRRGRFRSAEDRERQARLNDAFDYDDEGAFVDVDPDDDAFLLWLIGVIVIAAMGSTYRSAFTDLALELGKISDISVIDRLAGLVDPPDVHRITMSGDK